MGPKTNGVPFQSATCTIVNDDISLGKKDRTLYRARQNLKEIVSTELALSDLKNRHYFSWFAKLNSESVACAEQDNQCRFKRI
ncbi:hypothetical protein PHMEG_00031314 [Phytophthora megakarya]|uniref:Uncharacterized protein n=1 Tax=Phytophthora megakarya TaxID=4795 RepID=A0A225UZ57_9STRA|nr:hypothetical protein PHMEG_00031314 [Phytophthora megakarya]